MDIKELEIILKDTKYEPFIGNINYVQVHGNIYKNLFKIGNDTIGYSAIKILENDNKFIFDSIENIKTMKDQDNLINKYIDVIEKDNFVITVSEWLNGHQPTINYRENLPNFFYLLGRFNKQNVVNGPFTSMYVDYKYFETVEKLIDWESKYHLEHIHNFMDTSQIENILLNLKKGIPCIISEDMNTGNLLLTDTGNHKIIDTEWLIKGLNLYQFEKINYFDFDEKKWSNITEEARECYIAYFDSIGVKKNEANEQIRSFELLQVLRTNTCNRRYLLGNNEKLKSRINMIITFDEFI